MATDFGTIDDRFLDHNTLHTIRTYAKQHGDEACNASAADSRCSFSTLADSDDGGAGEVPTASGVSRCLALLHDVAEEWKQQNSFMPEGGAGKELLQRQIETLHAIRRHYIDEIVHFLEQTQSALERQETSVDQR